jgi:hypothetical protein
VMATADQLEGNAVDRRFGHHVHPRIADEIIGQLREGSKAKGRSTRSLD